MTRSGNPELPEPVRGWLVRVSRSMSSAALGNPQHGYAHEGDDHRHRTQKCIAHGTVKRCAGLLGECPMLRDEMGPVIGWDSNFFRRFDPAYEDPSSQRFETPDDKRLVALVPSGRRIGSSKDDGINSTLQARLHHFAGTP